MVIKIPRWAKGCEAISLSYDCRTQSTRAFLQWIPDKEHDELVDFLHDKSKNPAHRHPLFLPARILCNHRRRAETYRIEVDRSILRIELFVGYAVPGQLYHKPSAKQAPTSSVEGYGLEDIVRRLHASSTELGGLSLEATFGKELGAFLMATERELAELGAMALDGMPMRVSESVMDQVKFNSNLFLTMGNQVAILKERVQNHINLVSSITHHLVSAETPNCPHQTFSLIAQEENKLNRTIAENSKRDSAAMKTIAVLTMFFLPPTFVAVRVPSAASLVILLNAYQSLFSMSMFDWNSDKPGSGHMSKYFWVYWAVAAPLTIIVLIFWRVWWKLEERRHGDGFHKAKQG